MRFVNDRPFADPDTAARKSARLRFGRYQMKSGRSADISKP
jgi:hypothetical protein